MSLVFILFLLLFIFYFVCKSWIYYQDCILPLHNISHIQYILRQVVKYLQDNIQPVFYFYCMCLYGKRLSLANDKNNYICKSNWEVKRTHPQRDHPS